MSSIALVGTGGRTDWLSLVFVIGALTLIWTVVCILDACKIGLRAAARRNYGLFVLLACILVGGIGHVIVRSVRA